MSGVEAELGNNGSYITGNSEILPFVFNTEQPQSDARLLEIYAKTLSKKKHLLKQIEVIITKYKEIVMLCVKRDLIN